MIVSGDSVSVLLFVIKIRHRQPAIRVLRTAGLYLSYDRTNLETLASVLILH